MRLKTMLSENAILSFELGEDDLLGNMQRALTAKDKALETFKPSCEIV